MKNLIIKIFGSIYWRLEVFQNSLKIFLLRLKGARIGSHVKFYGRVVVLNPKNLNIGNNTSINEGTLKIVGKDREHVTSTVKIEDNVWIASGVIISADVVIGQDSIIGAGSVVVKSIPRNVFL